MGNSATSQLNSTISDYTKIMNTVAINITNSSNVDCNSSNFISFTVNGKDCAVDGQVPPILDSTFPLSQEITSNCNLSSENASDIKLDFKSQIQTATDNFVKSQIEQEGSWLQTAVNISENNITNYTQLTTLITSTIVANISDSCAAQITAANHAKVLLCGPLINVSIPVSQKAMTTSITSCINKNVFEAYTTNVVLKTIVSNTEAYIKQKGKGPLDFLTDLFGYIFIAGIISVVVGAIVSIVYYMYGKSSKTTTITKTPAKGSPAKGSPAKGSPAKGTPATKTPAAKPQAKGGAPGTTSAGSPK